MADNSLPREEFEQLVIDFVESVEIVFDKKWDYTIKLIELFFKRDLFVHFVAPNFEKRYKDRLSHILNKYHIRQDYFYLLDNYERLNNALFNCTNIYAPMHELGECEKDEDLAYKYKSYKNDKLKEFANDFLVCYERIFYFDLRYTSDMIMASDCEGYEIFSFGATLLNPRVDLLTACEWRSLDMFLRYYRKLKTLMREFELFTRHDVTEINSDKPYVYFILDAKDGKVKIGRSHDPEKRVKTLQTGHPGKLELICKTKRYDENAVHKRFAHYKFRGEWFEYSEEIKHFISTL